VTTERCLSASFEVDVRPETITAGGGRLLTASLSDRHGDHGEILSCLVTADGVVESLVLSCRVFQRRVEFAFFNWLVSSGLAPSVLKFAETPRNEPIQRFLVHWVTRIARHR